MLLFATASGVERIAAMALDAPLAALERHCGLARGHGRFFLNAGAFIGLMVVSNALEEELYTNLPGFDYFKAVACLELATFAGAALYSERRSGLKTPRKAPLAFYAVLGTSMALSQTLGKLANKYVNFTVSTIFKCSKALRAVGRPPASPHVSPPRRKIFCAGHLWPHAARSHAYAYTLELLSGGGGSGCPPEGLRPWAAPPHHPDPHSLRW